MNEYRVARYSWLTVLFLQLEGHSVQRIYLRRKCSDSSVNKTILKPRRQYVYDVKFRVAAQFAGNLCKAAKFCKLYDIGKSNPVPVSGLWSGLG